MLGLHPDALAPLIPPRAPLCPHRALRSSPAAFTIASLALLAPIDERAHPLRLRGDELHVWTLALDVADTASRQRSVARASLRLLLGSYLGIGPRDVELTRGVGGRPQLAAAHDLSCNLSHTAGLALFAVGRGRTVGVDVESLARRAPSTGLIERALNPWEASRVQRAGAAGRTAAFLAYWTVKEAYVKALGSGLALDLRTVGVAGGLDRPRLALPEGSGEWHVQRVWPSPGFVGAVVADGGPWRMHMRELPAAAQLS
jgi:phosphopantetheinyl transferase